MTHFLPTIASSIALSCLAVSGIVHVLRHDLFRHALRRQDVWKDREDIVAHAVAWAEATIGLTGLLALINALPARFLLYSCAAAGATYGAYALYSVYLLRHRPGAPCGCSSSDDRVSVWTVVRVTMLLVYSIAGAFSASWPSLLAAMAGDELAIALLSAFSLGLLTWVLPQSMDRTLGLLGARTLIPTTREAN